MVIYDRKRWREDLWQQWFCFSGNDDKPITEKKIWHFEYNIIEIFICTTNTNELLNINTYYSSFQNLLFDLGNYLTYIRVINIQK